MGVKRGSGSGLGSRARGLVSGMKRELATAVEEIAEDVQRDAQISITTGSVSGKNHKPSAPGTPPNNDLGGLSNGIIITGTPGALTRRVVSTAPYGAIQELGGTVNNPGGQPYFIKDGEFIPVSKSSPAAARLPKTKPHTITLPERPYMRPAAKKNKARGVRKMAVAVDHVLKGGKFRGD